MRVRFRLRLRLRLRLRHRLRLRVGAPPRIVRSSCSRMLSERPG